MAKRVLAAHLLARCTGGDSPRCFPVIRAGDRLVGRGAHGAWWMRCWRHVALEPAAVGAVFEVRLTIGGRVVRAVALGPGRAAL